MKHTINRYNPMKKAKLKLQDLKVKSFTTSSNKSLTNKSKGSDGGYTWVG